MAESSMSLGSGRMHTSSIQLPGGVIWIVHWRAGD
jgi:hypothetical protein